MLKKISVNQLKVGMHLKEFYSGPRFQDNGLSWTLS